MDMLDRLNAQRRKLVLQIRAMKIKLASLKPIQVAQRVKLLKSISNAEDELKLINKRITLVATAQKHIGIRPVAPKTPSVIKKFDTPEMPKQFHPSFQSFQTPVLREDMPIRTVQSMPKVMPSVNVMPQFEVPPEFVAEEPVVVEEVEVIQDATEGFDLMTFLDDNKLAIGLGLAGAVVWFALGGKKKPKSNPRKRKSLKRKSKRKTVRKNKRRSGYHRS